MTRLHEHAATPSAHCRHVRMFAAEFIVMQQWFPTWNQSGATEPSLRYMAQRRDLL